jgi:transaldolase
LEGVESVASFFVSRVDTEVDHRLEEVAARDKNLTGDVARLRGQAGIANSRLAYEVYERMLQSPRWKSLAAKGAKPQRLLWASTGVKDKSFPDTRYVVELVAPDTVNTMPEATLQAVADHGEVRGNTIRGSYAAAHAIMEDLRRVGIDVAEVAELLEAQGTASFEKSWEELIASVTEQLEKAGASVMPSGAVKSASGSGDTATPAAAAPSHGRTK